MKSMLSHKIRKALVCLVGIAVVCVCSSGCTKRIGDFSIVSTGAPQFASVKNVPVAKAIEATDGRFWFLFIPLQSAPNLQETVDRCLDQAGGDYMERVRIYETGWSILLFSYGAYTVIGDIGNSKLGSLKTEEKVNIYQVR